MPRKFIDLLIIDPQMSFCRVVDPAEQQLRHDGELCIPGAWEDMNRVAKLVNRLGSELNDIHVTLDSHHQLHVANPMWFRNSTGNHPAPFTFMHESRGVLLGTRLDQTGNRQVIGEFNCFRPSAHKRTVEYLKALEASGRYQHCIWPPHCLIGTPGHNVVPQLMEALHTWERIECSIVDFVTKGSNPYVEHFSAVRAEVVDPQDPTTQLNIDLINTLMLADEILIAGEAGSHSLADTVRDIADSFKDDSFIKKCVLLTDAISPFPGFETEMEQFIHEMESRGMTVTTTFEYLV